MPPKEFKYDVYRRSTDLIKARFAKLLDLVTKVTSGAEPPTPVQLRQLHTIFAELKKKKADFEGNFNRLLETEALEATETVLSTDVDEINDLYVQIAAEIEVATVPDPTSPSASSDEAAPQYPATAIISGVKLPKLNLQSFDGTPLKWISFINLFDTAVHKNTSISNVSKFQYLLSVLSGEPHNLVKSLSLTAPNYLIAYQLLKDRYHNIRRLTTLHLNYLLDLPMISHNNPKQLRSFIATFYEHTESLKALDCSVTENNPLLSAHLLRKLDTKMVQKLEQCRESKKQPGDAPHSLPSVDEIIQFLNLECSHAEDASLHSGPGTSNSSYRKPDYKNVRPAPKATAFVSTAENKTKSAPTTACFCCRQQGHKIYSCNTFKNKSPKERYQIVKDHRRCISYNN